MFFTVTVSCLLCLTLTYGTADEIFLSELRIRSFAVVTFHHRTFRAVIQSKLFHFFILTISHRISSCFELLSRTEIDLTSKYLFHTYSPEVLKVSIVYTNMSSKCGQDLHIKIVSLLKTAKFLTVD